MRQLTQRHSRLALMLIGAVALALAGCASGATSATSTTPNATAPLSATATTAPNTPSATATLTAYAPPCATSQLRLAFVSGGVALGHSGMTYQFTNISQSACSLKGFPAARLLDSAGRALPIKVEFAFQQYLWSDLPGNTIELPPGGEAYDETQVQDGQLAPGDTCLTIATTILYPPRNTTGLASSVKNVTCNGALYISPFVAAQSDL